MQDISEPLSVTSMCTAQVGRGPDVFFESEVLRALVLGGGFLFEKLLCLKAKLVSRRSFLITIIIYHHFCSTMFPKDSL